MTSAAVPGRRPLPPPDAEWLEADGLGGFASGTVSGIRRRRYHALLAAATTPPTGRMVLVSGFDAWIERTLDGVRTTEYLSAQRYAPDVVSRSLEHVEDFTADPWPTWVFRLAGGLAIEQELLVPDGRSVAVLRWRVREPAPGTRLLVRPFLVARDLHALEREDAAFRLDGEAGDGLVRWRPRPDRPGVACLHDGEYRHDPVWYRGFQLDEERARGFDHLEDAGAPGVLAWDLSSGRPAHWVVGLDGGLGIDLDGGRGAAAVARGLRSTERRRRATLGGRLERAAAAYLVRRGRGRTIVAGYPWFTDWGRDTFIAMRGLCLATGRLDDARAILLEWAGAVSEGMLPNRFADLGDTPEFNSVDASLWYVVAVHDFVTACARARRRLAAADRRALHRAVQAILGGYAAGTRYGIRMDADALLACGAPGQQLTWMDARIGDWVVTPRTGKPVEVQALWINALRIGAAGDPRWGPLAERATASFGARFWNDPAGMLYDVVDADHVPGRIDAALRPNQILAVGGLPHPVLTGTRAARVVGAVAARLLTPLGLRSLAPGDPGYTPRYEGGPRERDAAYHQGTVWPWLLGPFVEAWLRVAGDTPANRERARERYLRPLLAHLDEAGLGHVSEIADAEAPHRPRGCPFQAWSVGEALRIAAMTAPPPARLRAPRRPRAGRGAGAGAARA